MTETEWLECRDPQPMLEFLRGKASARKLRLFAVACCYRIYRLLPLACRNFNEVLERYADGLVTTADYQAASRDAYAEALAADRDSPDTLTYATASAGISDPPTVPSATSCTDTAAAAVACATAENAPDDEYDATYDAARTKERYEQSRLVRCIFTPFRLVSTDPAWLAWNNGTVRNLAQGIYDERAFDRMPILADALEDAGCHDADILTHCRGPGPHVRGCWVLDLLLKRA